MKTPSETSLIKPTGRQRSGKWRVISWHQEGLLQVRANRHFSFFTVIRRLSFQENSSRQPYIHLFLCYFYTLTSVSGSSQKSLVSLAFENYLLLFLGKGLFFVSFIRCFPWPITNQFVLIVSRRSCHSDVRRCQMRFRRGIDWSFSRTFATTRPFFLGAQAMFKFVLRAASTLGNTTGGQRTLHKFLL